MPRSPHKPKEPDFCYFCFERHAPTPECETKARIRQDHDDRICHLKEHLECSGKLAEHLVELEEKIEELTKRLAVAESRFPPNAS